MAAGFSVLCLGTIYGVIIGILLSFVAVILKATNPPRSFRGMILEEMLILICPKTVSPTLLRAL